MFEFDSTISFRGVDVNMEVKKRSPAGLIRKCKR